MRQLRYFVSAVHLNTRYVLAGPFHTKPQAQDALDRLALMIGTNPATLNDCPPTCQHNLKFNYTFHLNIGKRVETELAWFGNMIEQREQEGLF